MANDFVSGKTAATNPLMQAAAGRLASIEQRAADWWNPPAGRNAGGYRVKFRGQEMRADQVRAAAQGDKKIEITINAIDSRDVKEFVEKEVYPRLLAFFGRDRTSLDNPRQAIVGGVR